MQTIARCSFALAAAVMTLATIGTATPALTGTAQTSAVSGDAAQVPMTA